MDVQGSMQVIHTDTDGFGNIVYYVMDKPSSPFKSDINDNPLCNGVLLNKNSENVSSNMPPCVNVTSATLSKQMSALTPHAMLASDINACGRLQYPPENSINHRSEVTDYSEGNTDRTLTDLTVQSSQHAMEPYGSIPQRPVFTQLQPQCGQAELQPQSGRSELHPQCGQSVMLPTPTASEVTNSENFPFMKQREITSTGLCCSGDVSQTASLAMTVPVVEKTGVPLIPESAQQTSDLLNQTNTLLLSQDGIVTQGGLMNGDLGTIPLNQALINQDVALSAAFDNRSFQDSPIKYSIATNESSTCLDASQILNHLAPETIASLHSLLDGVEYTQTEEEADAMRTDLERINHQLTETTPEEIVTSSIMSNSLEHPNQGMDNSVGAPSHFLNKEGKLCSLNTTVAANQAQNVPERSTNCQQSEMDVDREKTSRVERSPIYLSDTEVKALKSPISNYELDFSNYPLYCCCNVLEKGSHIPVEKIWLNGDQMYYLPQIGLIVINLEECVGFLREETWYISVGHITQRLLNAWRHEIERYLMDGQVDKQFLSLEEVEYLKQRKCIIPSSKSGTMISLQTFRTMCKAISDSPSHPSDSALRAVAYGCYYKKVLEKHFRCSKCGGATKNTNISDKYTLIDSPTITLTPVPLKQIQHPKPVTVVKDSDIKLIQVGYVVAASLMFHSFMVECKGYISLKELISSKMVTLATLQTKLNSLHYRPRPAPTAVDLHFQNENLNVHQSLWIDLMTVRCICCMIKGTASKEKLNLAIQQFSKGGFQSKYNTKFQAVDDTGFMKNDTVYTLDQSTLKIAPRGQSISACIPRKYSENEALPKQYRADIKSGKSRLKKSKQKEVTAAVDVKTIFKPGVYHFENQGNLMEFFKEEAAIGSAHDKVTKLYPWEVPEGCTLHISPSKKPAPKLRPSINAMKTLQGKFPTNSLGKMDSQETGKTKSQAKGQRKGQKVTNTAPSVQGPATKHVPDITLQIQPKNYFGNTTQLETNAAVSFLENNYLDKTVSDGVGDDYSSFGTDQENPLQCEGNVDQMAWSKTGKLDPTRNAEQSVGEKVKVLYNAGTENSEIYSKKQDGILDTESRTLVENIPESPSSLESAGSPHENKTPCQDTQTDKQLPSGTKVGKNTGTMCKQSNLKELNIRTSEESPISQQNSNNGRGEDHNLGQSSCMLTPNSPQDSLSPPSSPAAENNAVNLSADHPCSRSLNETFGDESLHVLATVAAEASKEGSQLDYNVKPSDRPQVDQTSMEAVARNEGSQLDYSVKPSDRPQVNVFSEEMKHRAIKLMKDSLSALQLRSHQFLPDKAKFKYSCGDKGLFCSDDKEKQKHFLAVFSKLLILKSLRSAKETIQVKTNPGTAGCATGGSEKEQSSHVHKFHPTQHITSSKGDVSNLPREVISDEHKARDLHGQSLDVCGDRQISVEMAGSEGCVTNKEERTTKSSHAKQCAIGVKSSQKSSMKMKVSINVFGGALNKKRKRHSSVEQEIVKKRKSR